MGSGESRRVKTMHAEPINVALGSAVLAKSLVAVANTLPPELSWVSNINQIGTSGLLIIVIYFLHKDRRDEKSQNVKDQEDMLARQDEREARLVEELTKQRDKHEEFIIKMLEHLKK
jgi:hypothetical protein